MNPCVSSISRSTPVDHVAGGCWHAQGKGGARPEACRGPAPDAGRRNRVRRWQGGRQSIDKGGNREFGRADTKRPEQVPSPGRWIRSGRSAASGSYKDCAFLDWPADPYHTPSGGSSALTPDRSKTPATGSRLKGIDTRWPVTEAALLQAPFRSKAHSRRQGRLPRGETLQRAVRNIRRAGSLLSQERMLAGRSTPLYGNGPLYRERWPTDLGPSRSVRGCAGSDASTRSRSRKPPA